MPGFTLVEVMMAAAILVAGFLGMIGAVTITSNMMDTARRQTVAGQIINHEIELLRLQNWSTIQGLTTGPSGSAWDSDAAYNSGTIVTMHSAWYRCIQTNTNKPPPNATYWEPYMAWKASTNYVAPDLVSCKVVPADDRVYWYRCIRAHISPSSQLASTDPYWSTNWVRYSSGPITNTGIISGANFSISRSVADVVAGSLREVTFTVTWIVTTSRRNADGTALAFASSRTNSAYFGKYGLNLTYQRQ